MVNSCQLENEIFSQPRFLNSPWLSRNYIDWSFLKVCGSGKYYKKNEVITQTPDPSESVYYIAKGRVRTSVFTEMGEEKIILVVDEGNIIDAVSLLDGLPNYLTTTTVTNSLIYRISKEVFLKMASEDSEISMKIIKDLARKIRVLITQVEDLTFMSSSARIAKCIYRLCHEYGEPFSKGIKLNIKFTHQEMAIYAGTCRVTVSNILENMEKAGIIKKDGGHIIVTDIDRLRQCINSNIICE